MIKLNWVPKYINRESETYQTHKILIATMVNNVVDAFSKDIWKIQERVISLNNDITENLRNYGYEIETLINGEIDEWLNKNYDWEQELKTIIKNGTYNALMREQNQILNENN